MDLGKHIDSGFLSVDADARVGDVLELVNDLSPDRILLLETPTFGSVPEDDDVYLVFDPAELIALQPRRDELVGNVIESLSRSSAPVFETVGRRRRRSAARAQAMRPGGGAGAAVVMTRGVPDGVLPDIDLALAPPPPGDAVPGAALGVAVDHPQTVALEATFSLLISLTGDVTAPNVIPIVAAIGDQVDIVVSPKRGFVSAGKAEGRLEVTDDSDPLPIQLKLRATAEGPGVVTVYAFMNGSALGSLTVTIEVSAEVPASGRRALAVGDLHVAEGRDADLELLVLEQEDERGDPELHYRISSKDPGLALNLKGFGPVVLTAAPGEIFADLYREIEQLPVETEEDRAYASERLEAIGSELFAVLFPEDLRALLWELRDRIDKVWIQSDEPWVPWEICRLHGAEGDGPIVAGEFLCEAFELTRWIPGLAVHRDMHLTNIGVIVPSDSGLPNVAQEAAMIHKLAGRGRTVVDIEPAYSSVRQAFADASHDGIHFSGHGEFPDASNPAKAEIELQGGRKLRPSDISGVAANLGRARPLVFLNACQAGRQSRGLTGAGGWASALLQAGAAAFVGAHWEVDDALALRFATRFYERVAAGDSLAAAGQQARLAIRDAGDPTWLAYTVFADPGATVAKPD